VGTCVPERTDADGLSESEEDAIYKINIFL